MQSVEHVSTQVVPDQLPEVPGSQNKSHNRDAEHRKHRSVVDDQPHDMRPISCHQPLVHNPFGEEGEIGLLHRNGQSGRQVDRHPTLMAELEPQ